MLSWCGTTSPQGLTLVQFSAQLEPFLTQKRTQNTPLPLLSPLKYPIDTLSTHPLYDRKRLR